MSLPDDILNISPRLSRYAITWTEAEQMMYKLGHRDARQDAAELAKKENEKMATHLATICAVFGWRTDGDATVLAGRITHHIRDMKAGIKARDALIQKQLDNKP